MSPKQKILAVDDTPENLDVIKGLLSEQYQILGAIHGALALKIAAAQLPDLILLDVMMPEMDGYEVCRRLKSNPLTREIPIIFLTAKSEVEDEERGFELGAVDYITKPISPPILQVRVKTHLSLRNYSRSLEKMVEQRTEQLLQIQDATMLAMGALAEHRDPETGSHIHRTQSYVKVLAEQLQQHPRFSGQLSAEQIDLLHKAAPLHDIGKVAVPDAVLRKPGRLLSEEYRQMQQHAIAGRDVILQAESALDQEQPFLVYAREIACSHHEMWDGNGYPEGLKGEEIPLSARIMAIADVYDALVTPRVYKEAFTHQKAVSIIEEGRGSHFDPDMVDAFMVVESQFDQIAREYGDALR